MLETPLVSKSLKIDLQKSPDILGYDWFFLETPSSYRKKSHTCDSEKVGSYTISLENTVYTFFKPQQRSCSPYSVIFHNGYKSDAKYIFNYQIHSSTFSAAILHP